MLHQGLHGVAAISVWNYHQALERRHRDHEKCSSWHEEMKSQFSCYTETPWTFTTNIRLHSFMTWTWMYLQFTTCSELLLTKVTCEPWCDFSRCAFSWSNTLKSVYMSTANSAAHRRRNLHRQESGVQRRWPARPDCRRQRRLHSLVLHGEVAGWEVQGHRRTVPDGQTDCRQATRLLPGSNDYAAQHRTERRRHLSCLLTSCVTGRHRPADVLDIRPRTHDQQRLQ